MNEWFCICVVIFDDDNGFVCFGKMIGYGVFCVVCFDDDVISLY